MYKLRLRACYRYYCGKRQPEDYKIGGLQDDDSTRVSKRAKSGSGYHYFVKNLDTTRDEHCT